MPDRTEPQPAAPVAPDPVPLVPRRGDRARTLAPAPARRARPGRKPLPDAQAIVSLAVPDLGPPYDDAPVRAGTAARPGRRLAVVAPGAAARAERAGPPGPPGPGAQRQAAPGTGTWPSQFAQVLAETLAGTRPPAQIVPWTTEQARRRIGQLGPMLAAAHRPRVRRVVLTSPASGVIEMTVVMGVGSEVRALAVRLERPPAAAGQARPGHPAGTPRPGQPEATPQPGQPAWPAGSRAARSGWLCTAIEAA